MSSSPDKTAAGGGPHNPFNFQTQTIKDTPVIAKSVCLALSSYPPSSNVSVTPFLNLPKGENKFPASRSVWQIARTPPHLDRHVAYRTYEGDDSDCVSPLPSEQAGNAFGRRGPPSPSFMLQASSPIVGNRSTIRERRHQFSNLTPPTDTHPYTFPNINQDKQNIGQRRGHRYKHSSVSTQHQIFLEPPPRAPLALPASLPIPNSRELWASTTREQRIRLAWCLCHCFVAAFVNYSSAGSLALTALSHLIFFDAISAFICVSVDVFHNFEVWKRSSIRHPFGLERAEVVAGFAMSVFLLFMGFDLISHNLKHMLESLGTHRPHHPHSHVRVSPGSVDFAALLSIIATLVSAFGLKNHARIGKAMRFAVLSNFPSVLSNPSHFLTLSWSTIMLLLPLLSLNMYKWLDRLFCTLIGGSMFMLGLRLAIAQSLMLLMSYSGKGVSDVMREIANEPQVSGVEEARFWQVHYGLCMANLKLRVRGMGGDDDQALGKLRERIVMLVRNRLGGGYGKGEGLRWEVTIQFSADRDRDRRS
jgi:divalent metal cation (Fe/Co/Zn/Cd) transporter